MDLQTARQHLLRTEATRTDQRSRHVLWENGQVWNEQFEQLLTTTINHDERLRHAVDSAPSHEQRRLESDERMQAALDEERWNQRFSERLKRTLNQQRSAPQPNRALIRELEAHMLGFELYWRDRQVVMCQIALEHMEYRRALGRLSDDDWRKSWSVLFTAHRLQTRVYEQSSGQPLAREFYTARLTWYRRLRTIQSELQRERRGSRVDQQLLRAHAAEVDQQIQQLEPSIPKNVFLGVLGAAAVVVLLGSG